MPFQKLFTLFFLFLSLLFLSGCSASNPPWALVWSASNSARQNIQPQAAYTICAYAQKPDGTTIRPTANVWLATGSSPRIGVALSQLDASGQFFAAGVIGIDPSSGLWLLTDSISVSRPDPGSGVPASQMEGNAWTLPPGNYNSAAVDVPDTQPGGSLQLWVSNTNQEFVLARLYTTLAPPAIHTNITLAGQPGWLATQDGFTLISLTLANGNYQGLGTLLFAGTTNVQQSQLLAAQAAAHLNDLLPS